VFGCCAFWNLFIGLAGSVDEIDRGDEPLVLHLQLSQLCQAARDLISTMFSSEYLGKCSFLGNTPGCVWHVASRSGVPPQALAQRRFTAKDRTRQVGEWSIPRSKISGRALGLLRQPPFALHTLEQFRPVHAVGGIVRTGGNATWLAVQPGTEATRRCLRAHFPEVTFPFRGTPASGGAARRVRISLSLILISGQATDGFPHLQA
jgi:hypothetical protein